MDWGTIFVETIRVLLSAPVVFGGLIVYFLWKHGPLIGEILKRLSSVSFPGGVKVDVSPYPTISDAPNMSVTLPVTSETPKEEESLPQKKDKPENSTDLFRAFLQQGLQSYFILINQDLQMMWDYLMKGAFALSKKAQAAQTVADKLQTMKDIYKIDDRAVRDYYRIGRASNTSSSNELVAAYNKAILLHEYLLRHPATHNEAS